MTSKIRGVVGGTLSEDPRILHNTSPKTFTGGKAQMGLWSVRLRQDIFLSPQEYGMHLLKQDEPHVVTCTRSVPLGLPVMFCAMCDGEGRQDVLQE